MIDMKQAIKDGKQYVIYGDRVLDVATFKHPGPQKLITENIGKDVTELFDDIGHSASAQDMVKDLTVGFIKSTKP